MASRVAGCILCGGGHHQVLFKNFDRLHGKPGVFEIVKCENCGLVSTRPQPEDLSIYYPNEYEPYNFGPRRGLFSRLTQAVYDLVGGAVPIDVRGRILDVGCGTGIFLYRMKSRGWGVYGVDISRKAVAFARKELGLRNIKVGTLKEAKFPNNFFDVVNMSHLIEHLPDPLGTLREVKRALKPGGLLVVTTPNFDSLGAKTFREYWFPLDTPRHLFLFGPGVIKLLLDKVGGFETVRLSYDFSADCLVRSLGYRFGRPKFWLKAKPIFWPLTIFMAISRRSDVFTIVARCAK